MARTSGTEGVTKPTLDYQRSSMTHANAPLTPTGRRRLAEAIVLKRWTVRRAAERFQVSPATAANSIEAQFGPDGAMGASLERLDVAFGATGARAGSPAFGRTRNSEFPLSHVAEATRGLKNGY